MKNVQISQELFVALLHYHLSGENEYEEVIEQGLEQKLDAMLRHELYAQYKTAPTEEQREQARQEYLDRRGVPEASAGEFLYWQMTGACHAPVNAITQEGGVGPGSGEAQQNLVRRRKLPAGRKGIF